MPPEVDPMALFGFHELDKKTHLPSDFHLKSCAISKIMLTGLCLEVKRDSKSCLLERRDSSVWNTHLGVAIHFLH